MEGKSYTLQAQLPKFLLITLIMYSTYILLPAQLCIGRVSHRAGHPTALQSTLRRLPVKQHLICKCVVTTAACVFKLCTKIVEDLRVFNQLRFVWLNRSVNAK